MAADANTRESLGEFENIYITVSLICIRLCKHVRHSQNQNSPNVSDIKCVKVVGEF